MTINYLTNLTCDGGAQSSVRNEFQKSASEFCYLSNDESDATKRECGECSVRHCGAMLQRVKSAAAGCLRKSEAAMLQRVKSAMADCLRKSEAAMLREVKSAVIDCFKNLLRL